MKKKAITFIACTDTYQTLSSFSSLEELNHSIYNHITHHVHNLTSTMITILKLIGRYSVRYLGVSFLTKNKIGELVGKSRRTIIRICHELEQLGIIKQYHMKRSSDQQQTSNAIVIQPYIESVKSEHVTQDEPENVTPKTNSSPLNNLIDLKTYDGSILSHSKQVVNPPTPQDSERSNEDRWGLTARKDPISLALLPYESFREMCHCFTKEKKTVNRLYGVYLCQIKPIKPFFAEKELLNLGILAIKIAFQATKRKKINNLFGYYNGVLDQLLTKLYFEDLKANYWSSEEGREG